MPLQKDGAGLAGILSARHKAGWQSNINPEPRRSRKEAIAQKIMNEKSIAAQITAGQVPVSEATLPTPRLRRPALDC